MPYYPPPAFHFAVAVANGATAIEASVQDISGIEGTIDVEELPGIRLGQPISVHRQRNVEGRSPDRPRPTIR